MILIPPADIKVKLGRLTQYAVVAAGPWTAGRRSCEMRAPRHFSR
jgi:hypothetical protein